MAEELLTYGYLVLIVGSIVEGDATLATAGFLAHRGYFSLGAVLAVAMVASAAANELVYRLARSRGEEAFRRKAEQDPRYARVQKWVDRRGALLLVGSRFLWGLRIAIPAACGAAGMAPARFAVLNIAGAVIWSVVVGMSGYLMGEGLRLVVPDLRRHDRFIAAMLLVAGLILFLLLRRRDLREEVIAIRHPSDLGVDSAEALARRRHFPRVSDPPDGP